MPLINCEINFVLTWRADCTISFEIGATIHLQQNNKKLYIPWIYSLRFVRLF